MIFGNFMRKKMNKIYTFWEGIIPAYIELCMKTWKFPYIVLNYNNLSQYTDELPEKVKQLTLPKIADYVRVHVLRDNGGYWFDTDTIMLSNKIPEECILGDDNTRQNTIGFLHTIPHSDFFEKWAVYQDTKLNEINILDKDTTKWDIMGNAFTDDYLKKNIKFKIGKLEQNWPENYMITDEIISRPNKYKKFYFESNFTLNDIKDKTNMLMLHNSWTPDWYKKLSKEDVLKQNCTLSNILRELNEPTK